jgi:hypothetical protein
MVAMAESEEKTALKPNNFAQVHRRVPLLRAHHGFPVKTTLEL